MATIGNLFQSSTNFNVKSLLGFKEISPDGPSNSVFDGYSKMDSVDESSGNVVNPGVGKKLSSSSAHPGSSDNVSSGPGAISKSSKQSSSFSAHPGSSDNDGKHKSGKKSSSTSANNPTIVSNACLSFAYSERLRKPAPEVVEELGEHFTLDVIQDAHAALWRAAVTGVRYRKPNESTTGTPKQIRNHCASAVISKLNELDVDDKLANIKIVCPSEELFTLLNVLSLVYNPTKPSPIEDRVRALEFKVSEIEASNQRQTKGNTFTGRQKVINDVSKAQFTPQSAKRGRSPDGDDWATVTKRSAVSRPGVSRPAPQPSYWGRTNNVTNKGLGVEVHDVFLFNYRKIASEEVVKSHFVNHGIKIVKLYQRSREGSEVKSFVMRLENKEDFEKVIQVLPWQTGARWYERQVKDPAQRPAPYFNKVHKSDEFLLDRPVPAGQMTPAAHVRGDNLQYFTPSRGSQSPDTPAPAPTTSVNASVSFAPALSVSRMLTPLILTSSTASAPSFSIGGPLSSVGMSMSSPASSISGTPQ